MEDFEVEIETQGADQSLIDQFVERGRKLAPVLGPVVVDGVEVEIIEMTFTALMPAPSVVQLKPAEPKALIAG